MSFQKAYFGQYWCRTYSSSDPPPDSGGTSYSSEALSCTNRPWITGPKELWYFDGVTNVPNYATGISLTAHGAAAGSNYLWEVVAGWDKALFQGNQYVVSGTSNNIALVSMNPSTGTQDVSIMVTVDGISSARFKVTVSAPNSLLHYANNQYNNWDDFGSGYKTLIPYQINKKLGGGAMPSAVPFNERFPDAKHDIVTNDWPMGCPGFLTSNNQARFIDAVGETGGNPSPCHTGECATVLIRTLNQEWRIGSLQTGLANTGDSYNCSFGYGPSLGRLVQTDLIELFTDRGDHGNVSSPVP